MWLEPDIGCFARNWERPRTVSTVVRAFLREKGGLQGDIADNGTAE
jgi:hypothetical protein